MPGTPDDVIFSLDPDDKDNRISWGQLRATTGQTFRLRCLQARVEDLLLLQSSQLLKPDSYAPFPLAAITLIGVGAVGEIFFADNVPASASNRNKSLFCQAAKSWRNSSRVLSAKTSRKRSPRDGAWRNRTMELRFFTLSSEIHLFTDTTGEPFF